MSHLKGGKVDVSLIHSLAGANLISLIEKHSGSKALVWDTQLQGPAGLIAKYTVLKEYGVEKMYPIENPPLPNCVAKHIIFICRPKLELMEHIALSIKIDLQNNRVGMDRNYHLIFAPRRSLLCLNKLEHCGIKGSLKTIEEFCCYFFPFDSDLLSMEIPDAFREYNLENDPTSLYHVARSIIFLQSKFGPIGRVWGKGPASKQVHDLLLKLQKEDFQFERGSCIDQMILIDRSVDLISTLATQLTYEGLIDEVFGLNGNAVTIPADKLMSNDERHMESLQEDKKTLILDSGDPLYADLRDKNFNGVGPYLSKRAKLISAQLEDRHEKSVPEMKLFVQRLPAILANKKSLSQHTAIAECIKEVTDTYEFLDGLQVEQEFLNCMQSDKAHPFIEDMISQKKPLIKVLRLICLQCLTSSGLKSRLLDYYKREIVQVYGLEVLPALINLEKVGLLKVQSGTRQYTVLRKGLQLTVEDTSEVNPTDISYVHCIYAPLSVRLVEHLTKNGGWKQLQDYLGLLPGPTLEYLSGNPLNNNNSTKVVLIFFIGGCTFAEISALRFISKQEDSNVEFVIATTKLINGNTFLNSLM
ncbi:vacuolar protein sorting-associated protein 33A [Onthophagus taurus]|uniref:vacuolar protein sorting-associated protein 33A n=1 Tax=Onthophagus taurus TaxID=166361 RepID=UPI000C20C63F|nr:vacuolar protein sorting-associated protein 33A [Onthophagus taurus]